jgi:hypothetical protein
MWRNVFVKKLVSLTVSLTQMTHNTLLPFVFWFQVVFDTSGLLLHPSDLFFEDFEAAFFRLRLNFPSFYSFSLSLSLSSRAR